MVYINTVLIYISIGFAACHRSLLTPIPFSNASVINLKVNKVGADGVDMYDFTGNIYDETDVNEDGIIKIGEGYTSDGIHYEAFKPAVE